MKFLLHFLAGVLLCPLQEYGQHPILLDGEKWGESPALSGSTRPYGDAVWNLRAAVMGQFRYRYDATVGNPARNLSPGKGVLAGPLLFN